MPDFPRPREVRIAALASVALAACAVPTFEGPQLQDPPQGFLMVEGTAPIRQLVAGHQSVFSAAWVESSVDASSIFIEGYPAVLGYEDAVTARDGSARYALDPDTRVGEVEPITVDGRNGWGWEERVETSRRGLVWVAYRAFVPYDSVTYTIEFASGNPTFKRTAPDTLKAVISTFGIGRTTYNMPLIALGAGLGLFMLAVLRTKQQARASRNRSINLVKVPKKRDETKDQAAGPTAAVGASATPAAGTPRTPSPGPTRPPPRVTPPSE
jgi:hypothetical protein